MPEMDPRLTPLRDGDVLRVGSFALETFLVPGHTPGTCRFYLREQGILFTGDHVLFDITPNITSWPEIDDSLGSYIDQLRRVRDRPVRLALPGHRQTGDFRRRVDELLVHHERRLAEALSIIRANPGLCGYEIAGRMKWKIRAADWDSFPLIQKWFATGECLSHLDYLRKRGIVSRIQEGGRLCYYLAAP